MPLLLLAGLALGGCGDERPETNSPAPDPEPTKANPTTNAAGREDATNEPASSKTLAGVAVAVDERLAGLRGEVAGRYAQKLLETALPEHEADRAQAVLEALQNGTPTVRWIALLAVPSLASIDDALFRSMLPQTQAAEPYLRTATFQALRTAKHIDDTAAEHMWRVQAQAPEPLRAALLHGLGTARGSDGRKDLLRAATERSNPVEVRRAATFALMHLVGEEAPTPHPHADLVDGFAHQITSDEDAGVRTYAVLALARMGPAAAPAASELVSRLRDESGRVRSGAVTALVGIGDPALGRLREALGQRVNRQTELIVTIVRRMGTPDAITLLRDCLAFEDPFVRGRCTMALVAMKVAGIDALTTYRQFLREEDPDLVMLGLEGIGMLGRDGAPALDAVRPLANHDDERVRDAARVWIDLLDRR